MIISMSSLSRVLLYHRKLKRAYYVVACVAGGIILCGCEIKSLAAEPCSKKGSRDEVFEILAASPLVTAPPSNLTQLLHNTASYAG